MSFLPDLDPTLVAAARALGLVDDDAALVPEWFEQPLAHVRRVLVDPEQRAALLDLLEAALPQQADVATDPGVRWHPVLTGGSAWANLYVTGREAADHFDIGLAARAEGRDGDSLVAQLQVEVPLVRVRGAEIESIADSPLVAALRVHLGWAQPDDAIGVAALRIQATVQHDGDSTVGVVLEGADLGDGLGVRDVRLDPHELGGEAFAVVSAMARQRLARAASTLSGGALRVADHLPAVLGFARDVPSFAWERIGDPEAARAWMRAAIEPSAVGSGLALWLGHLAALVGGDGPVAAAGSGTDDDPFHAPLVAFADDARLELTARVRVSTDGARRLCLGVRLQLVPPSPAPVRVVVDAELAALAIDGSAGTDVLPRASLLVRSPGASAGSLVDVPQVRVGALQAGVRWDGSRLAPSLELLDVALTSSTYPRVDLTQAGSVVALAGEAVRDAIVAALGSTGAGRHLAVLAGLLPPLADPSWPHLVQLSALAADPARAIAEVHAAALRDPVHGWGVLFGELAALLGIEDAVVGGGTRDDPWRSTIATSSPVRLELVAWSAAGPDDAPSTTRLRLGLRAAIESAPWSFAWHSALLEHDCDESGGDLRLFGEQRLVARIDPVPEIDVVGDVTIGAGAAQVEIHWPRGGELRARASIMDVTVGDGIDGTTIAELSFPQPDGTDPAVVLGIGQASLAPLLRRLFARASRDWSDFPGLVATGLFGLHDALPGAPADWPTFDRVVADPLADPVGALRAWLARIAQSRGADGAPFAAEVMNWIGVLVGRTLQPIEGLEDLVDDEERGGGTGAPPRVVSGSGHVDAPWAVPVAPGGAAALELLAWLEPAGPPLAWISSLPQALASAPGFGSALDRLASAAAHDAALRAALDGLDRALVVDGLNDLEVFLRRGDGVVELASQVPQDDAWTAGDTVQAPHARVPSDPLVVAQVIARVEMLAPGERLVVLMGPRFADRGAWTELLARAESARPGSTSPAAVFAFRDAEVAPVTSVADYYVAELRDDDGVSTEDLVSAIERIVDALAQLRPGVRPILVGHSTAGVLARAFVERNPTRVLGLVTLAAPHVPALPRPLIDGRQAAGLRLLHRLFPDGFGDDAMGQALQHLLVAIDGGIAPARGAPNRPKPWPIERFGSSTGIATAGVPALAIGSALPVPLLDWLRARFVDRVTDILAHVDPPAPTHVAFGVRMGLPVKAADHSQTAVDIRLRVNGGRLGFAGVAPARVAPRMSIDVALGRERDWLVGSASAFASSPGDDVHQRLRRLAAGLDWLESDEGMSMRARVHLDDVAVGGDTIASAALGDATTEAALGELTRALADEIVDGFTPLGALFATLARFELAVVDARGRLGISSDAYAALRVDPRGFLAPRLRTALDGGNLFGLVGPPGGPWLLDLGEIELELCAEPWSLVLRPRPASTSQSPAGFALAPGVALPFEVALRWLPERGVPELAAHAALRIRGCELRGSSRDGRLVLDAPPFARDVELVPTPSASVLSQRIRDAIPRLLLSTVLSAVLRSTIDPGLTIGPLDGFLAAPGAALAGDGALGRAGRLDGERLASLLTVIARGLGQGDGDAVRLPGGVSLSIASTDPPTFAIATSSLLGGVLSFDLRVVVDAARQALPSGTIALRVVLPGEWPAITIEFTLGAGELAVHVTPGAAPPLQLLPRFGGLGALAGAAQSLLPSVLDAVVDALGPASARSDLARLALSVAEAAGIYDEQGGFAAHADALRELATDGSLERMAAQSRPRVVAAVAALFADPTSPLAGALPGTWQADGTTAQWRIALADPRGRGELALAAGWDAGGPCLTVRAHDLVLGEGLVVIGGSFGIAEGSLRCDATVRLPLATSLGISVEPAIAIGLVGDAFVVRVLPLGMDASETFTLRIAPAVGLDVDARGIAAFLRGWLVPLAGQLALDRVGAAMARPLWNTGPTARGLLRAAAVIEAGPGDEDRVATPVPDAAVALGRVVRELARVATPTIELTPSLSLQMVEDAGVVGMRLRGRVQAGAGVLQLTPLFGDTAGSDPRRGLTLELFRFGADLDPPELSPALAAVGLGLAVQRSDGTPLVSGRGFALGSVAATAFFRAARADGFVIDDLGAELAITRFGLPLGQAAKTGGNAIASDLLGSASGLDGDRTSPNPTIDVAVAHRDGELSVRFGGQDGPVWIDMQRGFGPVYIERIGVRPEPQPGASIMIDGSVAVGGLRLGFDGLGVRIPLRAVASPGAWSLALDGLTTSFSSSAVTISGGLKKVDGPPLEYRGAMLVEVAERTFSALGAYARPTDALGSYASLFVFAAVPFVLGGPPFFFVTELAGGFGYNRSLVAPSEPDDVESFPLLTVLDDETLVAEPMRALATIGSAIPPRRGSLWVAAGVEFSTFERLKTRAVVYASLDRTLEVGLVGISRMTLPNADAALVHVELGLLARYSEAEGLLSVRAQLTDSSWLLSRDCELTGGFAFLLWFREWQFVVTLGGYAPSFARPARFPVVPRLGFHWRVDDHTVVKGGCYFALTNSCLMTGGNLEAVYERGSIRAWFEAQADILIAWDPFQYDVEFSIDVGASWTERICFIKCVTLSLSASIGATLHLMGPPLRGEVTVRLAVASVTIGFGSPAQAMHYIEDWAVFVARYLTAGGPSAQPVTIRAVRGLVPTSSDAAPDASAPWVLDAEPELVTDTRMPAASYTSFVAPTTVQVGNATRVDIAPMAKTAGGSQGVRSHHVVLLFRRQGNAWVPVIADGDAFVVAPELGRVPEATWRFVAPDELAAAANTLPAMLGLRIRAVASFEGRTPTVAVDRMTQTARVSLPLPFATDVAEHGEVAALGVLAETVQRSIDEGDPRADARAVAAILAGENVFAAARARIGVRATGLSPVALDGVHHGRTSPPRIVPLAADLAMRSNRLAAPTPVHPRPSPQPRALTGPRLRGVLRLPDRPRTTAPAQRTTVRGSSIERTALPRPSAATRSRLLSIDSARPSSALDANDGGTALSHPLVGGRIGTGRTKGFEDAAAALVRDGIAIATGCSQVWQLPPGPARVLSIRGDSAWRAVQMASTGEVLHDVEGVGEIELAIGEDTERLAVLGLGGAVDRTTKPGFAAISARHAPPGESMACGWELGGHLPRFGERTLLARGSVVTLPRPNTGVARRRLDTSVRVAEHVAGQPGLDTWLPLSCDLVIVRLDLADATAADRGDLGVSIRGARSAAPLMVDGNRSFALLYPVVADGTLPRIEVAVASRRGFRIAGVVGVSGPPSEWADRLRRAPGAPLVPGLVVGPSAELRIGLKEERER